MCSYDCVWYPFTHNCVGEHRILKSCFFSISYLPPYILHLPFSISPYFSSSSVSHQAHFPFIFSSIFIFHSSSSSSFRFPCPHSSRHCFFYILIYLSSVPLLLPSFLQLLLHSLPSVFFLLCIFCNRPHTEQASVAVTLHSRIREVLLFWLR